jgi:hypothetical protein
LHVDLAVREALDADRAELQAEVRGDLLRERLRTRTFDESAGRT